MHTIGLQTISSISAAVGGSSRRQSRREATVPKSRGRKSKNHTSRRQRPGGNPARASGSAASGPLPSEAVYLPLPHPVWEMPALARKLHQVEPALTELVLLEMLLSHPLTMQGPEGEEFGITPLELAGDEAQTVSEVMASMQVMHELGVLQWDQATRTHRMVTPA